jgi:hypothetical protein
VTPVKVQCVKGWQAVVGEARGETTTNSELTKTAPELLPILANRST